MERTVGVSLSSKRKKEIKEDRQKIYRVIERLDFSRIYESSPVEVLEGYTVSEAETHKCFATFRIQNTKEKDILSLKVRLLCYDNANIPSLRIPFEYCAENGTLGIREYKEDKSEKLLDKLLLHFGLKSEVFPKSIRHGEVFGSTVFIPLPGNYCRKLELEIMSVVYSDGTEEEIRIVSGKKYKPFAQLNDDLRFAYGKVNIYLKAEEEHPIRIIPQQGENVWLCCCGEKNLKNVENCVSCGRERDWQFANITENLLHEKYEKIKTTDDPEFIHRNKLKATPRLVIENDEEKQKKIEAFEKALENVAKQEEERLHRKRMIVPKIIFCVALFYLLAFLLQLLLDSRG